MGQTKKDILINDSDPNDIPQVGGNEENDSKSEQKIIDDEKEDSSQDPEVSLSHDPEAQDNSPPLLTIFTERIVTNRQKTHDVTCEL